VRTLISSLLLLTSIGFSHLAQSAEAKQLFDGKSLNGWTMVGPGKFVIEDGLLKTTGGMGLLYYDRQPFGNATVKVVYKTQSGKDNSGVFIRIPEKPADPWFGVHNGYEVQIDAGGDEWHRTGAIYSLSRSTKAMQKGAGEWNTMEIELRGQMTRVRVNGELVNEFDGTGNLPARKQWYEPVRGPRPDVGYIGLQNHDEQSAVLYKEVSVVEHGPVAAPKSNIAQGASVVILYSKPKNTTRLDSELQGEHLQALKNLPKVLYVQISKGEVKPIGHRGDAPYAIAMLQFASRADAEAALASEAAQEAAEKMMQFVDQQTKILGFETTVHRDSKNAAAAKDWSNY
jgi:uncharacterized protein (TIGR02118 family)